MRACSAIDWRADGQGGGPGSWGRQHVFSGVNHTTYQISTMRPPPTPEERRKGWRETTNVLLPRSHKELGQEKDNEEVDPSLMNGLQALPRYEEDAYFSAGLHTRSLETCPLL